MADRILTLDIETADADALFTMRVKEGDTWRDVDGPFCRLAGYAIDDLPVRTTTDMDELLWEINKADLLQGQNLLGFDLLALAWHHGLDWATAAAKTIDTDPLSRQHTPPRSREHGSADLYDLDHVAKRLGVAGKITGDGGLAALKRKYGGYDRIPVDDPDYVAYLIADVEASRAVGAILAPGGRMNDYARREHRLATLAGHMTLNGFLVDVPLLKERIKEGQERKIAALEELHASYGVPITKEITRGRKPNKITTTVPVKAPLSTRAGKDGLIAALRAHGVRYYPFTEKTTRINPETGREERDIAAGRESMERISNRYGKLPGISRLCELVTTVTTTRTIYQMALDNLAPDGRIHPRVSMRQASGRWSVTPGMTVFGKHGGRWTERMIFVAEPGFTVITCDLSQVDMRAVAAQCQDPAYMKMFAVGAPDPHQATADMFGISRQDAKGFGHGEGYGLGAKRLIKEGHDPAKVHAFFNGMVNNFPRRAEWREEVRADARAGKILNNGFGRRMRCDPQWAYTVGPALMGQGAARDITCEVVLILFERHPEYLPYLRNHAHDEFVFVVPEDQVDVIGKEIKDGFTWEWRGVPILADLSPTGPNWGVCSAK